MKRLLFIPLLIITVFVQAQNFRLQKIISEYFGSTYANQVFYYSGDRSSDYKHGIINYDSSRVFRINSAWDIHYTKKYDGSDRLLIEDYSSYEYPTYYSTHTSSKYTYDANGLLQTSSYYYNRFKSAPYTNYAYYVYDTAKRLVILDIRSHDIHSGYTSDTGRTEYAYDSLNRLSEKTLKFRDTVKGFLPIEKYVYGYDSLNRLISEDWVWWDSIANAWMNRTQFEYVYSGTNVQPDQRINKLYDTATKTYTATWKDEYVFNSLGDTLSTTHKVLKGTSFNKAWRREILYNIYDQPDTLYIFSYNVDNPTSSAELTYKFTYIYEIYWPNSVTTVEDNKSEVLAYPIPAHGMLTVKAILDKPQDVQTSIYDMQGRVVQTHTYRSEKTFIQTLPIADLPPGNYILKLRGESVDATKRFVVQ
ncbi:MAG: T9SS type A sorting domain-containing protein [Chitinophagales bacterium]|nr:T9SS type A sorting domain-containing protein [Chitinophagaceae bacterium]MCB9066002.1 T9SS type A sorting domain-containing protein [Chitinophagales bacterium]